MGPAEGSVLTTVGVSQDREPECWVEGTSFSGGRHGPGLEQSDH